MIGEIAMFFGGIITTTIIVGFFKDKKLKSPIDKKSIGEITSWRFGKYSDNFQFWEEFAILYDGEIKTYSNKIFSPDDFIKVKYSMSNLYNYNIEEGTGRLVSNYVLMSKNGLPLKPYNERHLDGPCQRYNAHQRTPGIALPRPDAPKRRITIKQQSKKFRQKSAKIHI